MTKQEREIRDQKIIEMRRQGARYNEIALALGSDDHNIRKTCKRLGVEYTEAESAENDQRKPMSEELAKERFEALCPGFEYVSGYKNNHSSILIRCRTCGCEFERLYLTCYQRAGKRCPGCENARKGARLASERMKQERESIPVAIEPKQQQFDTCEICGGLFVKSGRKRYCSTRCCNRAGERSARSAKDARRRGRMQNGRMDKDITLSVLYKRDHGECWICGGQCDWSDMEFDNKGTYIVGALYPSVDHVFPLSKGGLHVWSNVKLAHCRCNSLKSDKIYPRTLLGVPFGA